MARLSPYLQQRAAEGRDIIICGDWNIAHKEIDLKNWRGNQKNSGFLPEERAWLDGLFTSDNWQDAFRLVNQQADEYTWWSNRGQAWANNVGWRIDYQIISSSLTSKVTAASIYKQQRFSDHAPLIIDYQYP
jgi:exodeoxyribonuclease-3